MPPNNKIIDAIFKCLNSVVVVSASHVYLNYSTSLRCFGSPLVCHGQIVIREIAVLEETYID